MILKNSAILAAMVVQSENCVILGKAAIQKNYEEKCGKWQISHLITERVEFANQRVRIGDWEVDTVLRHRRKDKACLVTLVDGKSRFLIAGKAKSKKVAVVGVDMINALKNQLCYTIMLDRGKEFVLHSQVSSTLDKVGFSSPHPPWQRGINEKTNGLLREYFDLTTISKE